MDLECALGRVRSLGLRRNIRIISLSTRVSRVRNNRARKFRFVFLNEKVHYYIAPRVQND